jgi:hypothetical protein
VIGVGLELGIAQEKLMKEKLESDPMACSSHANVDYHHSKFGDQATPQNWPLSVGPDVFAWVFWPVKLLVSYFYQLSFMVLVLALC